MQSPKKSTFATPNKLFSSPSLARQSTLSRTGRGVQRYLPTYRLEPKKPFNREVVKRIIVQVLDTELSQASYNKSSAESLTKTICEDIKTRIKLQGFDRYRYVCVVTFGERRRQGYHSQVKFLWDHEKDHLITHTFERPNFFAVASVYALYYD